MVKLYNICVEYAQQASDLKQAVSLYKFSYKSLQLIYGADRNYLVSLRFDQWWLFARCWDFDNGWTQLRYLLPLHGYIVLLFKNYSKCRFWNLLNCHLVASELKHSTPPHDNIGRSAPCFWKVWQFGSVKSEEMNIPDELALKVTIGLTTVVFLWKWHFSQFWWWYPQFILPDIIPIIFI